MLDIRKQIHVTDFSIDENGVKVNYLFKGEKKLLELTPDQAVKAMEDAGIIDGIEDGRLSIGVWSYKWKDYVHEVGMYQYAAILLAVNHEAAEQRKKEVKKAVDPLFEMMVGITKAHAKIVYGINL